MKKIFSQGAIEIWRVGDDFYVYGVMQGGDVRICPSEAMAREVVAGALI